MKTKSKLTVMQEHMVARQKLWGRKFTLFEKLHGYVWMTLFIKKSDIEQATANISQPGWNLVI